MYDIKKELKNKNLTEKTYEMMLEDFAKKTYHETDLDWSEIATKYNLG